MQATIEQLAIPSALRTLSDPPARLFIRGTLPTEAPVAIVGSRKATAYGRRVASSVAARLAAAGVPVVSGLAFGIDTMAHRGALDAGGRSIAVLPGGLDDRSVSPQLNLPLARRILEAGGALISEYPAGTSSRKEHYFARNRLISGLSRAVVVVEAALPSGSLLTANHAANQGREVWAVPGPIESAVSAGTNNLIDESARPLISIDHFCEALGITQLVRPGDGLLGALSSEPIHIDALSAKLAKPLTDIETELTKLELRGVVRNVGGRRYVRA